MILKKFKTKMKSKKKAMFFTLIALMLVSSLIVTFTFTTQYRYFTRMKVVETRAMTMNNFIHNVERDMERALYISGFRAIVSIDNYIITNGSYVDDIGEAFQEVIINGTLYGQEQLLMRNQTITDWSDKITDKATEAGLVVDMDVYGINMEHVSPWLIEVSATMNFSLTDTANTAEWERTCIEISNNIELDGFEDPLFAMNTGGKISRTIERTNITVWDRDTLYDQLRFRFYRPSISAPSFLMRLANNLSASPYGIESLVDTNELLIYGQGAENDSSAVDYLYWNGGGVNNSYIDGITNDGNPYFKLDQEHVVYYNVQNETY